MAFASIYVPNFMVQAVVRAEPSLRRCAIALVSEIPPLFSVVAADKAALNAGIQIGMAKAQAAQFSAVSIRKRSRGSENAAHAALLDLGWFFSPRVEDDAPDTVILDLSGLETLMGAEQGIAGQFAKRAASLGLRTQIAIAANPDASFHAALGFSGITLIPAGEESQRLALLPVHILRPSMETLEIFERWGIRTCGALAALPILQLSERLGQEGVRLHELARGATQRSLVPAESRCTFEEEIELDDSVAELEPLTFLLSRLLNQLCARLAARSLAAMAIRSRFELERFGEQAFESPCGHSRAKIAAKTHEKILTLPVPMRDPRILLKLLRLQLQSDPPSSAVVKIALVADPARPRTAQNELFLPSSPNPEKLEVTIARLTNLVGDANVGSPVLNDTHRPGAFRMDRFIPPSADREMRRNVLPAPDSPGMAFRVFRPAPAARVQLREGHPIEVEFRGLRGDVIAASGPWRTSGDWWREDAWRQDEWDLEIRFPNSGLDIKSNSHSYLQRGVYRIYFDALRQSWFVRGMFD